MSKTILSLLLVSALVVTVALCQPRNVRGWAPRSDGRLKTEIKPIQTPLKKVMNLKGVTYIFKADKQKKKEIGLIAQEVEKVVPEVVGVDHTTGFMTVNYKHFVPLLVEAIKQQQKQINSLKAKVNGQKAPKKNTLAMTESFCSEPCQRKGFRDGRPSRKGCVCFN